MPQPTRSRGAPSSSPITTMPAMRPPSMTRPAGNLIFGAITTDTIPWVFCGNRQPSCGEGRVMIDASGSGALQTAENNEWGIAFQQTSPANESAPPHYSDRDRCRRRAAIHGHPHGVRESTSKLGKQRRARYRRQPGRCFWVHQPWHARSPFRPRHARLLRLLLRRPGRGTDDGFAVGDRFRFGANVTNGGNLDGDDVGSPNRTTTITVYYNLAPTATGTLVDTTDKKNDCYDPHLIDPITGTWVVSPSNVPDLPCPPTASATNNGQSYEVIYSSGCRGLRRSCSGHRPSQQRRLPARRVHAADVYGFGLRHRPIFLRHSPPGIDSRAAREFFLHLPVMHRDKDSRQQPSSLLYSVPVSRCSGRSASAVGNRYPFRSGRRESAPPRKCDAVSGRISDRSAFRHRLTESLR